MEVQEYRELKQVYDLIKSAPATRAEVAGSTGLSLADAARRLDTLRKTNLANQYYVGTAAATWTAPPDPVFEELIPAPADLPSDAPARAGEFPASALRPGDIVLAAVDRKAKLVITRVTVAGTEGDVNLGFREVSAKTDRILTRERGTWCFADTLYKIVGLIPSADIGSVTHVTKFIHQPKGSNSMATVTRSKPKAGKAAKAPKPTATKSAKPAAEKKESTTSRRSAADVDALVPAFLKHLNDGGSMKDLKAEHGFSDDGPIRAALYRAGYHKVAGEGYVEHGLADTIDASKAAGKKQLVSLRNEGTAWYALAVQSGLSESEVKAIVAEGGGETGRVYREAAPKEKSASKPKTQAAKAKAKAADPS